jgi:hypothetical protein
MKSIRTWLSGSALLLATAAWGAVPAHPGMLNYVEGQARIAGQSVTSTNVGTADVREGQVIETGSGKAEVLLTPGVFLRLGENSAVRMDSAGLTDTRVAVLGGRVMIEADNLHKQNNIQVQDGPAVARLEKNGIYAFSTNPGTVETFDGKVEVSEDDRNVDLGKGHEAQLQAPLQSQKFDRKAAEKDSLYQWSKLRSEYLAEANIESAQTLVVNNGGWYGGGWYWNPWFASYAWVPGDGMFWSPFGYGFYSPFSVWSAPVYFYGGGHRGFYRGGYRGGSRTPVINRGFVGGARPSFHSGFGGRAMGGGFHGRAMGGGFHGGRR